MPRKKASSQPLGNLLGIRISSTEQDRLLVAMGKLPPITYWDSDRTDAQKELFTDTKLFFQRLREEMELFFTGQGSNIPDLPERERGAMGAMVDRAVAWYAVIQRGWKYIEADLNADGLSLSDYGVRNPCDALIFHLAQQCAMAMSEGDSPYYRFSPSAERQFLKLEADISRGNHTPQKISRYNSIAKEKNERDRAYMALSGKMMQVCEDCSQKDRGLARLIKAYKITQGNVDRECSYFLNKRQAMKGHEWRSGEKSPLVRG